MTEPPGIASGRSGTRTELSVRSTSSMRPDDTAARGIIIDMKVAIITDIRICMR